MAHLYSPGTRFQDRRISQLPRVERQQRTCRQNALDVLIHARIAGALSSFRTLLYFCEPACESARQGCPMSTQDREHLQDLRQRHQRRLRELERQAATFGASTPPEVRVEIEDIQSEIARIDAALARSRAADEASQPTLPRPARHNLPAQMTTLIGREHEAALVCALLRRPDVRLVTLTGPGGAGKTRLGLQIATALFDDFPDGVFFVALAPIAEPSLVVPTIAQALGLRAAE